MSTIGSKGGTLTGGWSQGGTLREADVDRRGTLQDDRHNTGTSYMSDNQTGTVFIRVSIPELKVQKCLQFELDESVWEAKQRILTSFAKDLKDPLNHGMYMPPMNGRAGKFLDEERLLREYPLHGPIGFLEFKYKRRVYKLIHLNPRKLKQLHNKTNFRQFIEHVKNGNLSKINKLLNRGLDPNFHEAASGETPLSYAVCLPKEKCREVILGLVSGGAHLDFRTKAGQTPMHKAVLHGNQETLKALLDLGAATNYKDSKGLTPLYYSVLYGKNPACAEMLLHERAFIGTQDEQGWYEIHQACRFGLVQQLEHLMFYGADLDVMNASGNTPLHVCAVNAMEQCARVLLFRGASRSILNYNNQTAQQVAVIAGSAALAELIRDFNDNDMVPFREVPTFSRRRLVTGSSTMSLVSRSRSESRLDLAGALDGVVASQPVSMRSLPHMYHVQSDSGSYPASRGSDSPRSLSLSSNSSGPVNSVTDTGYWEGSINGRDGWFPADHIQEVKLRNKAGSLGDLLDESRETTRLNSRNTLAALIKSDNSDYSPRTVVLQRSPEGYGFVLRGAKSQLKPNGDLDFRPTPEFPALQYLDSIDPGSASDRAGLKPGDFILTINGENVVRASHDRVVQLIRGTGDTLAMKVVTVRPASRTQDWFAVQDHAMTMPNRKKKAPEPPRRDPTTSLSFSRSEGQAASDELAAFEKLDNAILEKQILEEKKTASIRARLSTKRVSCVDMDKIGVNEAQGPELQIKRNGTQSNGNLERSKSTPDLLDGGRSKSKRDILYATPTVPNKNVYAVPNVNSPSSGSVVAEKVRPKGPPPLPPSEKESSPRKQAAPKPPATTEPVVVANKTEIITINTQRKSPYMSSTEVRKGIDNKKRESSFRPSTAANLSEEHASSGNNPSEFKPGHVRASSGGAILVKQTAVMSTSEDDGERHNVSFAEDKVLDNAATFLKKHPNAQLLVTAEVHNKKGNRNSQPFEPEPDYDNDEFVVEKRELPAKSRENRQSVTVISVGDEKKPEVTPGSKRYTIHSTIPDVAPQSQSIFIPPRPQGPAPQPPNNRPESPKLKSAAPEPPPLPTSPPPTLPQTPPPDFDTAPFPLEPQQQPAPPPPPPPPPPAPPVSEVTIKQSEVKADFTRTTVPQDAIAAAVAKRQARIQAEGITVTPQKQKPAQTQMDSNQAAILAAVAKRRHMLEQNDETAVIDSIENRLQRTKKLQAAKFQIAGSKVASNKKETDKNPDAKVNGSVPSLTKNKTVEEPKEFSFKVKPTTNPVQISNKGKKEITPKIVVKPSSKVNTVPKPVIVSPTENKQPKTQSLKLKPQPLEKTISNETKNKTETEKNAKNDNGQADFLALAEKKRQEYLLRKSQKSPPDSTTTSPRSSSAGTPEKGKFRSEKLEVKSVNKTNYSPPVSTKPKTKIPVKGTTTDVSYTEFQSSRGLVRVKPLTAMNGDVSQNEKARNITNVPPPPLEFRDLGRKENTVVQLEIIPPPSTFSIDSGTDMSLQHSPAFSPDTASLVSSLSTLSSLSGDQNDIGKGDGYEDMIAPPPPGFDDIEDVTPSVIPPPPEFEGENKTFVLKNGGKSFTIKPVESWLCVDVLDWLDNLNMSQYKASFQKNSVNGQQLLSFSRNNYIDLGVTQVGHRMNLERSIKKAALRQNSVPHDVIASEHL